VSDDDINFCSSELSESAETLMAVDNGAVRQNVNRILQTGFLDAIGQLLNFILGQITDQLLLSRVMP